MWPFAVQFVASTEQRFLHSEDRYEWMRAVVREGEPTLSRVIPSRVIPRPPRSRAAHAGVCRSRTELQVLSTFLPGDGTTPVEADDVVATCPQSSTAKPSETDRDGSKPTSLGGVRLPAPPLTNISQGCWFFFDCTKHCTKPTRDHWLL